MSDSLDLITYCGLYCGLCSNRNRIPQHARQLKGTLSKEGYEHFGPEIPLFNEFWQFLNLLEQNDAKGKGCACRTNGGPPFCGIRKCARKKNVQICVDCAEYPCHRIHGIAKGYPTMLADSKRMKEIGIDAWVSEQEKRKETGFCYVDIRCNPYEVPTD